MATDPVRLSNVVMSVLRKLSDAMGIGMADWMRDRIRAEEIELTTRVQPLEGHPSLVRDLWAYSRSTPEGRRTIKEKILLGLQEGGYDLEEIGVDSLTPLHWAARGKNADVELVEAILSRPQDVSPRDSYGNTPLVLAIQEQDRRLETNLPVIQLLLSRSLDRDLLVTPLVFGGTQGIYDFAASTGMKGTATLIRERFQRFQLDPSLGEAGLSVSDIAARVAQVLYYQGRPWAAIAAEMSQRGMERSVIWFHLNRLGAWRSFLEELKLRGESDQECAKELRSLGATWADIAWAYVKNGFPSEEIVQILYPFLISETDSKGSLAWMVAGSIDPDAQDNLRGVRDYLQERGEDPESVVEGMPFLLQRKTSIRKRMGLEPS